MSALSQPRDSIEHDRIRVGGDEIAFRVTTDQSRGALVSFDVRMPAGGGPPMLHRHDSFEAYRVERGAFAFYLGSHDGGVERVVAGPGDVVAIPSGREHTVRNESAAEARAFVVLSPGVEMERFARAAAELHADAPPQPEEVLALAEAHGIELTRPAPVPHEPFTERWATLLGTRKRDGTWVDTPVNLVVDRDRAYFGTPANSGKVKRLRNFSDVRIAPCTLRGKPTGPSFAARARRLDGDEAEGAIRALRRKHRLVHRFIVPLEHRIARTHGVVYELTEISPALD
jgi:PPOX class probable F420-dependent enzyme